MAKRRETEPGGIYHAWTRGSNREPLYWDDVDHENWERWLGDVARGFGWVVLAFVELGNHFHLVLRTPEDTLARGMQQLNGVYSRRTNARHSREAHLFRQRFRSNLIRTTEELKWKLRYVDRNPVEAGLCERPEEHRWGSHAAVVGLRHPPAFLAVGDVLALFDARPDAAVAKYRDFVAATT
jgi:putative transposase